MQRVAFLNRILNRFMCICSHANFVLMFRHLTVWLMYSFSFPKPLLFQKSKYCLRINIVSKNLGGTTRIKYF